MIGMLSKKFFERRASVVAPKLLGMKLRTPQCEAIITEVEAYEGENDDASHASRETERSRLMRETYGHWYVYFTYGMHYCMNITCGKKPGAILIREAVPVKGIRLMERRRGRKEHLCDGPGKLCQAFGIGKKHNGLPLGKKLWIEDTGKRLKYKKHPRIGISAGLHLDWRFRAD